MYDVNNITAVKGESLDSIQEDADSDATDDEGMCEKLGIIIETQDTDNVDSTVRDTVEQEQIKLQQSVMETTETLVEEEMVGLKAVDEKNDCVIEVDEKNSKQDDDSIISENLLSAELVDVSKRKSPKRLNAIREEAIDDENKSMEKEKHVENETYIKDDTDRAESKETVVVASDIQDIQKVNLNGTYDFDQTAEQNDVEEGCIIDGSIGDVAPKETEEINNDDRTSGKKAQLVKDKKEIANKQNEKMENFEQVIKEKEDESAANIIGISEDAKEKTEEVRKSQANNGMCVPSSHEKVLLDESKENLAVSEEEIVMKAVSGCSESEGGDHVEDSKVKPMNDVGDVRKSSNISPKTLSQQCKHIIPFLQKDPTPVPEGRHDISAPDNSATSQGGESSRDSTSMKKVKISDTPINGNNDGADAPSQNLSAVEFISESKSTPSPLISKSTSEPSSSTRNSNRKRETPSEDSIRVLFTGVELTNKHEKMIKSIGGELLVKTSDAAKATHIIAYDNGVSLRRTPKLMIGICKTSNILHLQWLTDSVKAKRPLEIEEYLVLDDNVAEKKYNFKMEETLRNGVTARKKGGIFANYCIYFCKGVAGNKAPESNDLTFITEAAGGKRLKTLSAASLKNIDPDKVILVTSDPATDKQRKEKNMNTLLNRGAQIFTTTTLFNCVICQKILSNTEEVYIPTSSTRKRCPPISKAVEPSSESSSRRKRSRRS